MSNEYQPWELIAANGCVPDLSGASTWPASESGTAASSEATAIESLTEASGFRLAEVVIYQHIDFGGRNERTNLNWYYVGGWWNDQISSIVVVSGVWRFYEHHHYEGRYWDLRPGTYRWVEAVGIPNDMISSFQLIAW